VRGALQVDAIEPYSTQILRETRSIHFQGRHLLDDRLEAAHVDGGKRIGHEIADGDARHLRLGVGTAHHVGVDHGAHEMRGGHQRLDGIASPDLERHDAAEGTARVLLMSATARAIGAAVSQPFLPDKGRAHVGDGGDPVVVGELVRRHQADAMAIGVESAHVEETQVGLPPPPVPRIQAPMASDSMSSAVISRGFNRASPARHAPPP